MYKIQVKHLSLTVVLVLAAGCSSLMPDKQSSDTDTAQSASNQHMRLAQQQSRQLAAAPIMDEQISSELLPPLEMPVSEFAADQLKPRFDLVVNQAPAQQVFVGIASGTPYSMLVHPDVNGEISVNLKNVTLHEALESLRELYGYEYQIDGQRIYVRQPGIQSRLFRVNYIVGKRQGRSDIEVTAGGSASSEGGQSSRSRASSIASSQDADFWHEIESGIRAVLDCDQQQQTTQNDNTENTTVSGCGKRAVLVNPMSGTVFVRAMPDELRLIGQLLNTMQRNIARQVILEAKIIDVELNSSSQQGINWAGFRHGAHHASVGADAGTMLESSGDGGTLQSNTTLGGLLGTGMTGATDTAFSSGVGIALQINDFSALINFLQTQGTVNVLSSPRIATTNNQKAVLKIGKDEQYVTGFESDQQNGGGSGGGTTIVNSGGNNQPTPVYSTFFSGISLDVTPQIDDRGTITLHVHPLVSEVTEVLKRTVNNQLMPFASNKISETDSVVKVRDGQIVVIGGLMTESQADEDHKVSGLGDMPLIGGLFRKRNKSSRKRELVIMLKPTIVKDNQAWSNDISATTRRMEALQFKTSPAASAPSGD